MPAKTQEERLQDIRSAVEQMSFAYKANERIVDEPPVELRQGEAIRRAEAVLFAAGEPLSAEEVGAVLPEGEDAAQILMTLQEFYRDRGVNLVEVGGRWRFQTATDLADLFTEVRDQDRKLSGAALETLAIIAYCQPVTRAEIEDVRGVAVSKGTLDILLECGWVRLRGRRRTPGRPVTYGTTPAFLEHFGLENLDVLPGKSEFQAAGLLDNVIPPGFEMPKPTDELSMDEDPLEGAGPQADDPDFVTDFMDGDDEKD